MKRKRKITFNKTSTNCKGFGFNATWYEVNDSHIIKVANKILEDMKNVNFISFKSNTYGECILKIKAEKNDFIKFVTEFTGEMNGLIKEVKF